jgi:hypothetical protein
MATSTGVGTVSPNQDFINKTSNFSESGVLKSFDWSGRHEFAINPATTITSSTFNILLGNQVSTDISLSGAAIVGKTTQVRITDVSTKVGNIYTLENQIALSDGTTGLVESQALVIRNAQAS